MNIADAFKQAPNTTERQLLQAAFAEVVSKISFCESRRKITSGVAERLVGELCEVASSVARELPDATEDAVTLDTEREDS